MKTILSYFFFLSSTLFLNAQTAQNGVHFRTLITNGGFEQPGCSGCSFGYGQITIPNWTYQGTTWLVANGSAFGNTIAPEGTHAIALQKQSSITTTFNVWLTDYYRFRIKAAQRFSNKQTFRIFVDGMEIAEITPTDNTFREYISVPFTTTGGNHTLTIEGINPLGGDNTCFIDNVMLEEPRRWNDPGTWIGGVLPTLNSDVIIGTDAFVVLDGTCSARKISVMGYLGGVNNMDFNLTTQGVMVHGGIFEIGQPATPYTHTAQITLQHLNENDNLFGSGMDMGTKVIGAMGGGTISFHGLSKKSWTQLDGTLLPGATQLKFKDKVDWNVGDVIIIASTDFDMNHAEEATINSIIDPYTITVQNGVTYKHFGKLQNYSSTNGNSWTLDERAEVGLLTRNIVIRGHNATSNGFGGHIMVMGTSKAYISSVELVNMGQKGKIGRYPFHWHLVGNGEGQYFKNSSIHHTYNRAVTIHGTNNTVVENNVAYDNVGHAYFFEDGTEIGNKIVGNLGLVTKRPATNPVLPSDVTIGRNATGPSTFWITNPNNTVNYNRAAGSDGSGFWLAFHKSTGTAGSVSDPNMQNLPLGAMDNNTAHSSFHGWIVGAGPFTGSETPHMHQTYLPSVEPIFKYITVFKNLMGTYSRVSEITSSKYENLIVADNYKGDVSTWKSNYNTVLWVGGSENKETPPNVDVDGGIGNIAAHIIYDGPVYVKNSHFAGITDSQMSLFDQWNSDLKFTGHTFENTTVASGSYKVNYRNNYELPMWYNAVVYDIDGKLTGKAPNTAIHQDHPFLKDGQSTRISSNNSGVESPHRFGYVEVVTSQEDLSKPYGVKRRQNTTIFRSDNAFTYDFGLYNYGVPFVPILNGKYTYRVQFDSILPNRTRLDYFSMNAGESVIIGLPNLPITSKVYFASSPISNSPGAQLTKITGGIAALKTYNGTAFSIEDNTIYIRYQAPVGSLFTQVHASGSILVCINGNCNNTTGSVIPDTDGDGYNCAEEQSLRRNEYHAKDFGFNFTLLSIRHSSGGTMSENWVTKGTISADCMDPCFFSDNQWVLYSNGNNPYLERTNLNFPGSAIPHLQALVRSVKSGTFELFWTTADEPYFNSNKSKTVNYSSTGAVDVNTGMKNIVFDLSNHVKWQGKTITGLQLHAPNDIGHFRIQSIWSRSNFLYGLNPIATSGPTITTLDGAGLYKYRFVAQPSLSTPFPPNNGYDFDIADLNADGVSDMVGINYLNTSDGKVQLTIADGISSFSNNLSLSNNITISTALWSIGQKNNYKFGDENGDGIQDLWFISHVGTASGKTEVHVANGASNFQTLIRQMATSLNYTTNVNDDFFVGDFDGDQKGDLWYVKSDAINNKTVVTILSNFSNFKTAIVNNVATQLPANTGKMWSYSISDFNGDNKLDLVAVNKQGGSGFTEVTILDGATNFQTLLYHQITKFGNGITNDWLFFTDRNPTFNTNLRKEEEEVSELEFEGDLLDFDIYPNPSNHSIYLNVRGTSTTQKTVKVFNSVGIELIKDEIKAGPSQRISTELLPSGQYYLSIQEDKMIKTKSFILIRE